MKEAVAILEVHEKDTRVKNVKPAGAQQGKVSYKFTQRMHNPPMEQVPLVQYIKKVRNCCRYKLLQDAKHHCKYLVFSMTILDNTR